MTFSPEPVPDQSAPLRAAVRYGVIGLIALAVIGSIIAFVAAGLPGLWGALIGVAVGGGFILCTALAVLFTEKLPPATSGAVLLGSWLLKMILAILVLGVLKGMDFYSKQALVIVMVLALIIVLGAETYGLLKVKVPYVTPTRSDAAPTQQDGPSGEPESDEK
ncbi:hypothetical protein ABIC28_004212 [Rhodococcus sp. PvR044]|uniref:hypothetical protein n=1 Tax=unclassified Rhodococcus (in: high G+C Gram-positive bacteria) TaxID=192944 RepID=UPI001AE81377|nr:hypothetical protein [Rhodococcus sp. PvR099]MBP1159663.1 hypothetical protein [Rhodococcus sp. PvR099]